MGGFIFALSCFIFYKKEITNAAPRPKSAIKVVDIDIRNYAKYILREGTIYEKRELLGCFKSRLILRDKILLLE